MEKIPALDIDLDKLAQLYPAKGEKMEYQGIQTNPTESERLFNHIDNLDRRLGFIEVGHERIVKSLDQNNQATDEILELVKTLKAGGVLLKWVGNVVKWGAGVVAGVVAVEAAYHQWLGK